VPTPTTTQQANARLIAAATLPRHDPAVVELVHEVSEMDTLEKVELLAFMLAPRAVRKRILRQKRKELGEL
jgi:hypothetical protein